MRFVIKITEFLKKTLKCRTWHIEAATVAGSLLLVYLCYGQYHARFLPINIADYIFNFPVELFGSLGVLYAFQHNSISVRMEEQQALQFKQTGKASVECYRLLQSYFWKKESCFLLYFLLTGTYAALMGVGVFLMYPVWRKAWRKAHPATIAISIEER